MPLGLEEATCQNQVGQWAPLPRVVAPAWHLLYPVRPTSVKPDSRHHFLESFRAEAFCMDRLSVSPGGSGEHLHGHGL